MALNSRRCGVRINGLTLNAGGIYLDSRVTSNFFDTGPYPLGPTDLINFKGEAFSFTPKWSVQYGGTLRLARF